MIIVGYEGCPTCKEVRKQNPELLYVELPRKIRGLGDLVAKITKFLHIHQCVGCARRQVLFNKWVPFIKGYDSNKDFLEIRCALARNKIRRFPVIFTDDLQKVVRRWD